MFPFTGVNAWKEQEESCWPFLPTTGWIVALVQPSSQSLCRYRMEREKPGLHGPQTRLRRQCVQRQEEQHDSCCKGRVRWLLQASVYLLLKSGADIANIIELLIVLINTYRALTFESTLCIFAFSRSILLNVSRIIAVSQRATCASFWPPSLIHLHRAEGLEGSMTLRLPQFTLDLWDQPHVRDVPAMSHCRWTLWMFCPSSCPSSSWEQGLPSDDMQGHPRTHLIFW